MVKACHAFRKGGITPTIFKKGGTRKLQRTGEVQETVGISNRHRNYSVGDETLKQKLEFGLLWKLRKMCLGKMQSVSLSNNAKMKVTSSQGWLKVGPHLPVNITRNLTGYLDKQLI